MKKYTKIKRLYYNKLTLKYRRDQYRYYIYKYKFEKITIIIPKFLYVALYLRQPYIQAFSNI